MAASFFASQRRSLGAFAISLAVHLSVVGSMVQLSTRGDEREHALASWRGTATRVQLRGAKTSSPSEQGPASARGRTPRGPLASTSPAALVSEGSELGDRASEVAADARGPPPAGEGEVGLAMPAPDVGLLHEKLAASARRCYPEAARRFRLTGRATVRFCLSGAGLLEFIDLEQSSGSSLLDDSARRCVVQGAMPVPMARGCYTIPVEFGG